MKSEAKKAANLRHYARFVADPVKVAAKRAANRARYHANKAPYRAAKLKALGIEGAPLDRRVGPCEICGTHADPLHLDHDHATKKMRGWLCGPCNRALGLMKDNVDRLAAAIEYLDPGRITWKSF